MKKTMQTKSAFTLIELLIVIAIILILISIALPNFLEAQTRTKVTRSMADMRTIGIAIEEYYLDHKKYIPWANTPSFKYRFILLTTPHAYMKEVYDDIFNADGQPWLQLGIKYSEKDAQMMKTFDYVNHEEYMKADRNMTEIRDQNGKLGQVIRCGYHLRGFGPDRDNDSGSGAPYHGPIPYSPTNGTTSNGDLKMFQGQVFGR